MKKVKSLEDLLKSVIKDLTKKRVSEEEMAEVWRKAAGDAAAKHTKPVGIRRWSLVVNVDGSGWLYELTIKKREILKNLEGAFGGKKLKDIRFRIGEIK